MFYMVQGGGGGGRLGTGLRVCCRSFFLGLVWGIVVFNYCNFKFSIIVVILMFF